MTVSPRPASLLLLPHNVRLETTDIIALADTAFRQLGLGAVEKYDAAPTRLTITTASHILNLEPARRTEGVVLRVEIEPGAETDPEHDHALPVARLAHVVAVMATGLPASHIMWLERGGFIPRDEFIAVMNSVEAERELEPAVEAPAELAFAGPPDSAPPEAAPPAAPGPLRPRRPTPLPEGARPRRERMPRRSPQPAAETCLLEKERDTRPAPATQIGSAGRLRSGGRIRVSARGLRSAFLKNPDKTELEALRVESGIPSSAEKATAWAVTASAAVVALPVAAPALIYNLTRGADLRVASHVMALAGFFVALNSSGAIADVTDLIGVVAPFTPAP